MEQPTRQLTKAEQKRYDAFLERTGKLVEKGYKRVDILVSIITANLLGTLIAAIPCVPAAIAFFMINREYSNPSTSEFLIFAGLLMIFIVIHELIHGLFWSFGAENGLKDIRFGFIVKYLTPYCTCASPLKKGQYILGTFMPMFLIGICPMIASIFIGYMPLFLFGVFHTLAGAGDILVIIKLLMYKSKGKDVYFFDHPYDCGLVAFEKE